MKIIAIDTSGAVASVALVTEDSMLAEYTLNYNKTHSQTLVPMLDEIVHMTETELSTVDAIAVTEGPGSFTGLRIGGTTAKTLGFSLNKPLIGVPTTEVLAYNFYGTDKMICPLMDARRSQVYTGLYEFGDRLAFNTIIKQKACDISEIINEVNEFGREVIFLGDGVEAYREKIIELVKVPYIFAPVHMSKQRAGSLGALALEYARNGRTVDADEFVPEYLRLSQAERELEEKKASLDKEIK